MKIVLALDSFKGTLTAREVCDAVMEGIRSVRSWKGFDPFAPISKRFLCPWPMVAKAPPRH